MFRTSGFFFQLHFKPLATEWFELFPQGFRFFGLVWFFFTPFVLKISVLHSKNSGNCSSVYFVKKNMIVVVQEAEGLEVKEEHLESRSHNM